MIEADEFANATEVNVGPASYDLRGLEFYPKDGGATELELLSGESVFIRSQGPLNLPSTLAACATVRNSRICQASSLDAPLCFPGH